MIADTNALIQKLSDPNLSRQRRYQIIRILNGRCESCGKPRGKKRKNMTRCKGCERRRYEGGKK